MISKDTKLTGATTPETTPSTAPDVKAQPVKAPAPDATKVKGKTAAMTDAFKAKGRAAREQLTEDQKAAEGSKSATLSYLGVLVDPSKKANRTGSGRANFPCHLNVGFAFVSSEDITVPVIPYTSTFTSVVDVDFSAATEVTVPAGQKIYVNNMELAALLSKPEYAGKANGTANGASPVALSVSFSEKRGADSPLPILRPTDGGGSVKLVSIPIADAAETAPDGKVLRWQVKPEFAEKFGVLFRKKTASRPVGTAPKAVGEAEKDVAAAFRQFLQSKLK